MLCFVTLRQDVKTAVSGIRNVDLQRSHALSRFQSVAEDQDFISNSVDFRNPLRFIGPNSLVWTNQITADGVMEFRGGLRLGFITHYDTALGSTLSLPTTGLPGEIFRTDVTGDGTTGDVLPETNVGSLGRDIKIGDLNNVISNYNNTMSGMLTPAEQAFV